LLGRIRCLFGNKLIPPLVRKRQKHHDGQAMRTDIPDPDALTVELQRQLRAFADALPDVMKASMSSGSSSAPPNSGVAESLISLCKALSDAHRAAGGISVENKHAKEAIPERIGQRGYTFSRFAVVADEDLKDQIERYIPPDLHEWIFNRKYSNFDRNELVLLIVTGNSIGELIQERFGCSLEEGERAESLIREFVKRAHGIELPMATTPAYVGEPSAMPATPPKYEYKPRMPGGIVQYLRDNWAEYIKAGILTRRTLRQIDGKADEAINNYQRGGRLLPIDVRLMTLKEENDRELADLPAARLEGPSDLARLSSAVRRRQPTP
jgi:hypothetical protein